MSETCRLTETAMQITAIFALGSDVIATSDNP